MLVHCRLPTHLYSWSREECRVKCLVRSSTKTMPSDFTRYHIGSLGLHAQSAYWTGSQWPSIHGSSRPAHRKHTTTFEHLFHFCPLARFDRISGNINILLTDLIWVIYHHDNNLGLLYWTAGMDHVISLSLSLNLLKEEGFLVNSKVAALGIANGSIHHHDNNLGLLYWTSGMGHVISLSLSFT
jgi:hypothetical protein